MKKYAWILVIFAAYLAFGNYIIIPVCSKLSKIETVRQAKEEYISNAEGFAEVLDFRQNNDLIRTFEIQGFAAIPTLQDNSKKSAKLILIGRNNRYEINGYFGWSTDLNDHFGTTGLLGGYHKFKAEFSSIPIRDDVYDVYIYDKENEMTYGLINTYTTLEKSNDSLKAYAFPEIEPMNSIESENIQVSLRTNQSSIKDECYVFDGLAIMKGYKSEDSRVFMQVTLDDGSVHTYPSILKPHQYFNSLYESTLYRFSNFIVRIPVEILEGKTADVKILINNENTYCYRDNFKFQFTETGYKSVYTSNLPEFPDTNIAVNSSLNNIMWNDLTKVFDDYYFFNGIAYIDGLPIDKPQMFLRFEYSDSSYDVYPLQVSENEWVTQQKGKEYAQSSYQVKISVDDIHHENIKIYMVIANGEKYYRSEAPVEFIWEGDHFIRKN